MKFKIRFQTNFFVALLSLLMVVISAGCSGLNEDSKDFDVQFKVPETLTVNFGSKTLDFRVMFGKAPLVTDKVVFGEPSGQLKTFSITETSQTKFTISLDQELVSGTHNIYIQRGNLKKQMGVTEVQITYNSTEGDDIKLAEGNNVYGIVSCGSVGLKDVVVSDGKVVTKTDSKGVYQFKSDKKHGYVFISVPSGYEAISEGILPKIHQQLVKPVATAERLDFPLVEAPGQEKHNILFFGDFQISNRNGDRKQFATFTSEVNEYLAANKGTKTYAITLGDMTWDLYWYSKLYGLEEYLADANQMKDLQIFHTIGNHDHDMNAAGDFYTVTKYKKVLAPTYFSFNIGGVHYVILDNIYCTNPGDGSTTRTYNDKVDAEQMEWLKKDLSYVPTSMPLVISLHAPVYNDSGNNSTDNASELEALVGKYEKVHYFTGHTHKMYNIDKLSEKKMFEHNAGAVCATWWWTGHLTSNKIHIGQDGAPGGYLIMNVDNKDFKWSVDFNIAMNRNKVTALTNNQYSLMSQVSWDYNYNSQYPYITQVGKPSGMMYGYIYEGTYKNDEFNGNVLKDGVAYMNSVGKEQTRPGDPKYRDINLDGVIDDNDRTIIGCGQPLHTGGFGNTFNYKNFDVNLFFSWSYGNDVINANRLIFENGSKQNLNLLASYADHWSESNPDSDIPRIGANGMNVYSSRVVEDGSFLRLKNLSVGYTFPRTVLRKLNVDTMRAYLNIDNLFTITKYSGPDPEVSTRNSVLTPGFDWSAYPRSRGFTAGVSLTF